MLLATGGSGALDGPNNTREILHVLKKKNKLVNESIDSQFLINVNAHVFCRKYMCIFLILLTLFFKSIKRTVILWTCSSQNVSCTCCSKFDNTNPLHRFFIVLLKATSPHLISCNLFSFSSDVLLLVLI